MMKRLDAIYSKGGMGWYDSLRITDENGNDVLVCDLNEAGKIAANSAITALTLAGYSIYKNGRCIAGTVDLLMEGA